MIQKFCLSFWGTHTLLYTEPYASYANFNTMSFQTENNFKWLEDWWTCGHEQEKPLKDAWIDRQD